MDPHQLVDRAREARKHAYAPYSQYPVGAAVLTASGEVFSGCNIENASYGLTVCAERTALFKAVSEGETSIVALAVVAPEGASMCGACRQVLSEFGESIPVYLAGPSGAHRATSIDELLPGAFGRKQLGK